MRQDRTPKPRPPGFRNNLSFNNRDNNNSSRDSGQGMGMGMGRPQFNSQRPQRYGGGGGGGGQGGGRPRPASAPKQRPPAKPAPIATVPDRWQERRAMLKAAAWRFAKLVHKSPAVVVATEDPYTLIRVPDIRARQLAKKIIRLRRTRKPAAMPMAKRDVPKEAREPKV